MGRTLSQWIVIWNVWIWEAFLLTGSVPDWKRVRSLSRSLRETCSIEYCWIMIPQHLSWGELLDRFGYSVFQYTLHISVVIQANQASHIGLLYQPARYKMSNYCTAINHKLFKVVSKDQGITLGRRGRIGAGVGGRGGGGIDGSTGRRRPQWLIGSWWAY